MPALNSDLQYMMADVLGSVARIKNQISIYRIQDFFLIINKYFLAGCQYKKYP